jgi:hypothetical protein
MIMTHPEIPYETETTRNLHQHQNRGKPAADSTRFRVTREIDRDPQ